MVVTKEYSIAYVQVLEVLKGLSKKEYAKIPKERIELYEKYKDKEYEFKLDNKKNFNEQISKTAQAIIANLFVKYVATDKDRNKIYEKEKQEFIKEELKKRNSIKLNPLFEDKNTSIQKEETALVIKKMGFFENLFDKLKNFLKFRSK